MREFLVPAKELERDAAGDPVCPTCRSLLQPLSSDHQLPLYNCVTCDAWWALVFTAKDEVDEATEYPPGNGPPPAGLLEEEPEDAGG